MESFPASIRASIPAPAPAPILAHALPAARGESRFAGAAAQALASPVFDKWEWPAFPQEPSVSEAIEPVEPDLPIHANLIEFPRELVATRKMRPRRAEGPLAPEKPEKQLSIFEVDPGDVSTEPESSGAAPVAAWPEPVWSEIELEPQSRDESDSHESTAALAEMQRASFGRRLLAALVDSALIAGAVAGIAVAATARFGHPHVTKIAELGAASAVLIAVLLYHALFLLLAVSTPGMLCTGVSLCTFDGQVPTRSQLRSRMGALLLSLLPVGLGVAWALFDDNHFCWHDRLPPSR